MTNEQELMWERLKAASEVPFYLLEPQAWISKRFALKKYLNLSDDEIDDLQEAAVAEEKELVWEKLNTPPLPPLTEDQIYDPLSRQETFTFSARRIEG